VNDSVNDSVNELVMHFHALARLLKERRPRPRWKTKLVAEQQLRWFRTTFLGRMPGWNPMLDPVGPWRPIVLEERERISAEQADGHSRVDGADGVVRAAIRLRPLGDGAPPPARATLVVGDARAPLAAAPDGVLRGQVRVPNVPFWWPHTHGGQP